MRTLWFWLFPILLYLVAAVVFGIGMGALVHLGWSLA